MTQKNNHLRGFIGAFLGALIGFMPLLVLEFGKSKIMLPVSIIAGFTCFFGYKLLKGKIRGFSSLFIILLSLLFSLFIYDFLINGMYLYDTGKYPSIKNIFIAYAGGATKVMTLFNTIYRGIIPFIIITVLSIVFLDPVIVNKNDEIKDKITESERKLDFRRKNNAVNKMPVNSVSVNSYPASSNFLNKNLGNNLDNNGVYNTKMSLNKLKNTETVELSIEEIEKALLKNSKDKDKENDMKLFKKDNILTKFKEQLLAETKVDKKPEERLYDPNQIKLKKKAEFETKEDIENAIRKNKSMVLDPLYTNQDTLVDDSIFFKEVNHRMVTAQKNNNVNQKERTRLENNLKGVKDKEGTLYPMDKTTHPKVSKLNKTPEVKMTDEEIVEKLTKMYSNYKDPESTVTSSK